MSPARRCHILATRGQFKADVPFSQRLSLSASRCSASPVCLLLPALHCLDTERSRQDPLATLLAATFRLFPPPASFSYLHATVTDSSQEVWAQSGHPHLQMLTTFLKHDFFICWTFSLIFNFFPCYHRCVVSPHAEQGCSEHCRCAWNKSEALLFLVGSATLRFPKTLCNWSTCEPRLAKQRVARQS